MSNDLQKVVLVLALLPMAFARAELVTRTTAFGDGADSYVRGSQSTTNFGASGTVQTRNTAGNAANNYKGYFRFDLTGTDPINLSDATLTFTVASNVNVSNVGYELYGLVDGRPGDLAGGWLENGITYANAPGNQTATTNMNFITTPSPTADYFVHLATLSPLSLTLGSTVQFSTVGNQAFLEFLQQDTNSLVTFGLKRTNQNTLIHLASKENTTYAAPTLALTYTEAVPEPAEWIVIICALGAAGFLFLRRKSSSTV